MSKRYTADPVWAELIIAHGWAGPASDSMRATAKKLREGCRGECRGYCASRADELERQADEIAAALSSRAADTGSLDECPPPMPQTGDGDE